jgi:hypothetical protein
MVQWCSHKECTKEAQKGRRYHHSFTTRLVGAEFMELADFLDHSKAINDVKVHWLRPQTHVEWFPYQPHTCTRCFRPFIWSEWADGSTIIQMFHAASFVVPTVEYAAKAMFSPFFI